MLEVKNLCLLSLVNGVFCFPTTTGIFQFFRVLGFEISSKKREK